MFDLNNANNHQIENIFSKLTIFSNQKTPPLNIELIKGKLEGEWSVNTYEKPRYIRWFISLFYKSSNCRLKNIQLFLRTFFEKNADPFTVTSERAKLVVDLNKKLHFFDDKICLYENILVFQVKAQRIIEEANLKAEQIVIEADIKAEEIIHGVDIKTEQIIVKLRKAKIKKSSQKLYEKSIVIFYLKNKEILEYSASRFSRHETLITGIINHSEKQGNNQYTINLENYSKNTLEELINLIYEYTSQIDLSLFTILSFLELYALADYLGFTEFTHKCKEAFQDLLIQDPKCIIDIYNTYLTSNLFLSKSCEDSSNPNLFIGEFLLTQLLYISTYNLIQSLDDKKKEFAKNLKINIKNDRMNNLNVALGICYDSGIGVPLNTKKAYTCYIYSNNIYGEIKASISEFWGNGVNKNTSAAKERLLKQKELPPFGYGLLGSYELVESLNEKKIDIDFNKIESNLKHGADLGCPYSQYFLGNFYRGIFGNSINKDLLKKYLELSAKQGFTNANYRLGKIMFEEVEDTYWDELEDNITLLKLYELATMFFNMRCCLERASLNGHANALFYLGLYYGQGYNYYEQDPNLDITVVLNQLQNICVFLHDDDDLDQKAENKKNKLIKEAAERGSLKANEYLGKEYLQKIVDRDSNISKEDLNLYKNNALKYFKVGLHENDPTIQYYCGQLYESIDNEQQALSFYEKSAEQGNYEALYRLGYYLYSIDNSKAFDYFINAAKGGSKNAIQMLNLYFFNEQNKNLLEYISRAIELDYSDPLSNISPTLEMV
jgi:TPR repeat protein